MSENLAVIGDAATTLPALIDRARARLAEARTSAEVLEVRAAAQAAMHYAKLVKASNEATADCWELIKRAEVRMADEIDAGQERGDVATDLTGGGRPLKTCPESGQVSKPVTLNELGVSRQRLSEWRQIRDAGGDELIRVAKKEALDDGRAPTNADIQRAAEGSHFRARGTGENEWYTPQQYLDAARLCLGAIDLDPASSVQAQKVVQAERFFTIDDDGLKQQWHGRIWLNPPYTQPDISDFVNKLVEEVAAGRTTEAILLTHNYTDTGWFHTAEAVASSICFTRGRIRFVNANGELAAPTQGQAFFYFGDDKEKFLSTFGGFGFIR